MLPRRVSLPSLYEPIKPVLPFRKVNSVSQVSHLDLSFESSFEMILNEYKERTVYLYFYIIFIFDSDLECTPFRKMERTVLEIRSFVSWSLFESFESSDERNVRKREVGWSRTKVKLTTLFSYFINCRSFYRSINESRVWQTYATIKKYRKIKVVKANSNFHF